MKTALWALDRILPYDRNPRKNEAAVAKVAASIEAFGIRQPIVVDEDGVIIVGHTRLLAARQLQIERFPVHVAEGLTPAQVKAYRIADNRTNEEAEWDEELLASELGDLKDFDFDLALTGFDNAEIVALVGTLGTELAGITGDDEVPETPAIPVSAPGDVWLLGGHRVMCGSSTALADVERLMGSHRAVCLWTDPPYNVAYEGVAGSIQNDNMTDGAFLRFLRDAFSAAASVMVEGAPAYIAHADTEGLNFRTAFVDAGFHLASCLIWRKNSLVLGHADYHWQHEPILYGWKAGAAHRWYGDRKNTTIVEYNEPFERVGKDEIHVPLGERTLVIRGRGVTVEHLAGSVFFEEKPARNAEHPTMKPVALVERMLTNSTKSNDLVLDLFGGSGSTLIAAQKLGRRAYLMELEPRFVDVIVRRWENFTGNTASLESGESFAAVEISRRSPPKRSRSQG